MRLRITLFLLCAGAALCVPLSFSNAQVIGPATLASTSTDATTQSQIDATNAQITELQNEIAQLQSQLNDTTTQKLTLQNAIKVLNLDIEKLQKGITLTQAQISQSNTQITQLGVTISTTSAQIIAMQGEVADSLQQLEILDQEPLIDVLLGSGSLSSFFNDASTLASLRSDLEAKIVALGTLKNTLQTNESAAQQKRSQLITYQQNLNEQKTGLSIARTSQSQLLSQTQDKESDYEAEIAQKQAQEAQFETELLNNGANLDLTVQAGSLPLSGSDPLQWPIDESTLTITQYFGNTPFATQNPSIYNGHGHDGIDIGVPPGTPIHAARAGVVVGTGNTDLTCPQASFGKWIFIQHDDGLSTMYAHLSTILVTTGQQVSTDQLIAYSDTTGYATGPHLHFGVYATQGSEIKSWPTTNPRPICYGKIYTMPVATLPAYLNPLSYLPPIPK